ncbi:uncharacterized protein FTOL_08837 [Fusarium torulosum]|uniref:Uncharacterized protein n=1 Tax=Fusarium torulosum TaxID=33205 RepID=A0AAE8MDG0_9HYPO|nr:uncharacterized protein FTOL_08837 [Fusarium torulosum]
MSQRSFVHHSDLVTNDFPMLWVGENAPALQRREYMYAFLLWMRPGTTIGEIQEVEVEFKDTSPTPQYPWDYSGPRYQFFEDHLLRHQGLRRFLLGELNSQTPLLLALTHQPSTAESLSTEIPPEFPLAPDTPVHHEDLENHDTQVPETRSAIALYLDRVADVSARLQCVEDENFDGITVAFLVTALDQPNSAQRMYNFLQEAELGMWYRLNEVSSKPLRQLTSLGSLREGCDLHGLNCAMVSVTEDDTGCRRLQFRHIYDQE